jgi:hypothetical protein
MEHEQDDEMMEIDPFEMMAGMLQTEEGETIADVLKGVSKQLETLNKLMVKLVAAQLKNNAE